MRFKSYSRRQKWWTKERIILGMLRFYQDFGFTPTSMEGYMEHAQFNSVNPVTGTRSNLGPHNKYPSAATIVETFASMRKAWTAAGFNVNRAYEEWSELEDWFVLESVGILFRSEVAAIIKRSEAAIKRRLYDLGDIRSYNRWGITLTHAEQLLKLPGAVIKKYLDYGIIPYFKGCKLYYLNPADLLKVDEVDWSKPIDPELDAMIRKALAQRVAKMIKYGSDWRQHEIYQIQKTRERYAGRIKNPRKSSFLKGLPALPNDLKVGDHVRIHTSQKHMRSSGARDRIGIIKAIIFSPQRRAGVRPSCWVARVEFPKVKSHGRPNVRRIHYTIPLAELQLSEPLVREKKPVSMETKHIRARKRFAKYVQRGRERGKAIAGQLT